MQIGSTSVNCDCFTDVYQSKGIARTKTAGALIKGTAAADLGRYLCDRLYGDRLGRTASQLCAPIVDRVDVGFHIRSTQPTDLIFGSKLLQTNSL